MKKVMTMVALGMLGVQLATAQTTTVKDSKLTDNWYIGVNGGVSAKSSYAHILDNLNPGASLRLGRWLTPSFGFVAEGTAYFGDKQMYPSYTVVKSTNIGLMGTVNLNNLLGGYTGQPRRVELTALGGLGWGHSYGDSRGHYNDFTSKMALDLAVNLGRKRAWQLYLEPSIVYNMNRANGIAFNVNKSGVGVALGLNYKFPNSNGTHNFKVVTMHDQYEVDQLNRQLNELRYDVQEKEKAIARDGRTIRELRDSLEAARQVKPATIVNRVTQVVNNNVLQPTIIFGQGKSAVEPAQMASVAMIAKYMRNHPEAKILIKGYASPEGNPELNQRLSEARANAVKQALVSRYGISESRLATQGMGATDELFEEIDFNRVATFTDTSK
ncbi:MAG: OmpA family protein [Prevotella sp.]|nr:OmpA family protein [Prevotella sp.]